MTKPYTILILLRNSSLEDHVVMLD